MESLQNTILIIEDDLGLNELICEKMTECGYKTHSALSALQANNWLSTNSPIIMVVDYSLNDMTAKDFIVDMQEKGLVLPPFIIATGQGDERIAVEMMKLGARDYIIKETNLLDLLPTVIGRVVKEVENEFKLKRAQEELKESEIRFRKLLQDIQTVSVQGYAPDGTTQYWNKASERLYGYTAEEAIGKNLIDLIIPTEMRTGVKHAMEQMAKSGQAIPASELALKRKDGSQVSVISNHAIVQVSGQLQELFCIDIDLTEIKQTQEALRESEEKFRILFSKNPQPMFVYNLSTLSILEVNQTALNFYGYTKDECLKMTIQELHPAEDIHEFTKLIEQSRLGDNTDGITRHIKKNGEVIIVEIFSAPANFLGENARLALVVDITERKKMEEAVKFLITCGVTSSGEDFFESLAKYLAEILDMEYVCIDKLDPDGLTAHTLANYNEGTFDSNISYTLHQTPCGEAVGKNICCFPENVCKLFPYDTMLVNMNAESYVGTTLWSFDGKPIGLIAIIGRKPLKNRIMAENILRLVSVRASGELERKKAEEALIKKVNELSYMNKFMVNREVRMAEMKKEINEMLVSVGKEKRYL